MTAVPSNFILWQVRKSLSLQRIFSLLFSFRINVVKFLLFLVNMVEITISFTQYCLQILISSVISSAIFCKLILHYCGADSYVILINMQNNYIRNSNRDERYDIMFHILDCSNSKKFEMCHSVLEGIIELISANSSHVTVSND